MPNSTDFFECLERSLSKARFSGYKMQGGTEKDALAKCLWNTLLCESLYPGFQILEVAFRNSVHAEISRACGNAGWLSSEPQFLFDDELEAIRNSKGTAKLKRLSAATEDILVAEMKFGFWTSLLDSRYETLWHKIIAGVFPHMPKTQRTRPEVSKMMNTGSQIEECLAPPSLNLALEGFEKSTCSKATADRVHLQIKRCCRREARQVSTSTWRWALSLSRVGRRTRLIGYFANDRRSARALWSSIRK